MKTSITICRNATLLAALLFSAAQASAAWNTIYEDTFSGLGSTSLNGAAPTTRPGSETWAFNNATALDGFKADGTGVATGGGANGQVSALLPFSPLAGNKYRATGTMQVTAETGQWFALGFTQNLTTPDDTSGIFGFSGLNSFAWALQGGSGSAASQAFAGAQTGNIVFNSFATGLQTWEIVLDTTPAQWTVDFYRGGIQRGVQFTYAINPTINGVGFSKGQDVGGIIDNFKLEVEVIPEPTSMTLALLGGLSFLIAAKRRRSGTV